MNLEELQAQVLSDSWPPPGAPQNLLAQLRTYVVSALIETQRMIPCLRYRHDDIIAACNTYWHCGSTQVQLPQGKILRVYTVQDRGDGKEWCTPVILSPMSLREIRRWQAKFRLHWRPELYLPPNETTELPLGFDVPNQTSDAVVGRSMSGYYAIDDTAKRLIVVPWLQSYESLVIEWQGIKRVWAATDLVPSDPDFIRLIRLWVEMEYGKRWGCADLSVRVGSYREHLSHMFATCREETRTHGEPVTAEEVDVGWMSFWSGPVSLAEIHAATVPINEAVVSFTGNTGLGDEDSEDVAGRALLANPPPELSTGTPERGWHVLLGNNVISPTSVAGALAPYNEYIETERLLLALGREDLDAADLGQAQFDFLVSHPTNIAGNSRWYSKRIGPVELFVIDGGFNTAGTVVEPDGNWEGSNQHLQIHAAIIRSSAPWKVAVVSDTPFSSGSTTGPGRTELRWISDLPVNAIVAGQAANYERGIFSNRLHLIAGTGGDGIELFGEDLEGSEEQAEALGVLVMTATCDELCFEFQGVDGTVLDAVCLDEKDPPTVRARTGSIWYGRSTNSSGFTSTEVQTWTEREATTRVGNYSFVEGDGYLCFAIPVDLGAPADLGLGEGFRIGAFPAAMARPDGTPPYGVFLNGYGIEYVTFGGVSYRVYRTYNILHGSVTLSIT